MSERGPEEADRKPVLVLVGGPAGCGKTTLARALSDRTGLVHLSRDAVKSGIGSTHAVRGSDGVFRVDPARAAVGGEYGQRAFATAYSAVAALLAGGASVVMDQAWRRGVSEAELAPLVRRSRAVLVTAVAPLDVAASRITRRGERPGLAGLPETVESLFEDWDAFLSLDLQIPQITVDTADGYDPDIAHLERWIWRRANEQGAPAR